jgi:hypothetical protein
LQQRRSRKDSVFSLTFSGLQPKMPASIALTGGIKPPKKMHYNNFTEKLIIILETA